MIKLKYLIGFCLIVIMVYIFTMGFNLNPFMEIKEQRDNTTCHCKYSSPRNKILQKLEQPLSENKQESFCSDGATRRGAGQRVISFSMYGEDNKAYINGLLRNINAINKLYSPQYISRLYYSGQNMTNKELLCSIFCNESNLDLCDVNDLGM